MLFIGIGAIMLMALSTTKGCKGALRGMAFDTLTPNALMCAGIDGKKLSVVIKISRLPSVLAVAGGKKN